MLQLHFRDEVVTDLSTVEHCGIRPWFLRAWCGATGLHGRRDCWYQGESEFIELLTVYLFHGLICLSWYSTIRQSQVRN